MQENGPQSWKIKHNQSKKRGKNRKEGGNDYNHEIKDRTVILHINLAPISRCALRLPSIRGGRCIFLPLIRTYLWSGGRSEGPWHNSLLLFKCGPLGPVCLSDLGTSQLRYKKNHKCWGKPCGWTVKGTADRADRKQAHIPLLKGNYT